MLLILFSDRDWKKLIHQIKGHVPGTVGHINGRYNIWHWHYMGLLLVVCCHPQDPSSSWRSQTTELNRNMMKTILYILGEALVSALFLLTLRYNTSFNLLFWQFKGQLSGAFIWISHYHSSYLVAKDPVRSIPNAECKYPNYTFEGQENDLWVVSRPHRPIVRLVSDRTLFIICPPTFRHTNRGTIMIPQLSRYQYQLGSSSWHSVGAIIPFLQCEVAWMNGHQPP